MEVHFSDVSLDSVDVSSYDDKQNEQRYVRDCLLQTDPGVFASRGTQIIRRKLAQVQTEDDQLHVLNTSLVPFNDDRLTQFLNSVEDMMFDALEQNLTTDHFAGYVADWSIDQDIDVKCINTFNASAILTDKAPANYTNSNSIQSTTNEQGDTDFFQQPSDSNNKRVSHSPDDSSSATGSVVSCISWNAQGSLFAASLSQVEHEHWCVHKSAIVLWNISRSQMDENKPHNTIECSGCITSLSFHPINPALLAAVSFNGEAFIYDLSKDESAQLVVNVASLHTEPISTVSWIRDPQSNAIDAPYMLVTSGQDGKVLLSSLNERNRQLTLISGQVLLAESMNSSKSSKTTMMSTATGDSTLGVTVLCTFLLDQTSFVIGSETGGVFKCSFLHSPSNRIVHSISQQDVQFSSAAQLALQSHLGPVTSMTTCPFHWRIVLTTSSDATLRLYNVLQVEPCLVLKSNETVCSVDWSLSRPMVFAAVTTSGSLLLFDLLANQNAPVQKLQLNTKARSATYGSFVKFSAKRPEVLATGDSSGRIKLWHLSSQLIATTEPNELALLEKMCSIHPERKN